jgi:ABC-type Mn2+/Zn2+ transport system permease subunit
MIGEFLISWNLFHNTYVVGWLIALLLSLVGVLVVARDQIFIGAAVSQASTLGIALAMWIASAAGTTEASWLRSNGFVSVMAITFSVLAALITAGGGEAGEESREAITGWVFLASASLAILVVAHSPHGLSEILRLLSSSIIGATAGDVLVFGGLSALTVLILWRTYRRALLLVLDPLMAAATGMRITWWTACISAWLGLAVGLSIRVSGMLYTFGCLVLPALIAKNLGREVRPMFVVAPVVAVGTATVAFVLANHYDYPPAQMTVALLSSLLMLSWGLRWVRQGR